MGHVCWESDRRREDDINIQIFKRNMEVTDGKRSKQELIVIMIRYTVKRDGAQDAPSY